MSHERRYISSNIWSAEDEQGVLYPPPQKIVNYIADCKEKFYWKWSTLS